MKNFYRIVITLITVAAVSLPVAASDKTPGALFLESINCTKALIINGDDMGRTEYGNKGILKGFNEGLLTSTSLMTPALAADKAYEMLAAHPELDDVGVHLVIARDDSPKNMYGPILPISQVPTLADENGIFYTSIQEVIRNGAAKEIGMELEAQVKAAYDNGVDITHLDCHGGFYHTYDPKTLKATIRIASKYDLPLRWVGSPSDNLLKKNGILVPDYLVGIKMQTPHDEKKEQYINLINNLKDGITEIFIHPATGGFSEEESVWRNSDLAILTDNDIKALIKENNICMTGYKELRDFQRKLKSEKNNK